MISNKNLVATIDSFSQVFNLLSQRDRAIEDAGKQERATGFKLLGQKICLRGLARILGIGSSRLVRLRKAINSGDPCPLDGRVAKAGLGKRPDRFNAHKQEKIHEFLNNMWLKFSEPMPEVNANHGGRQQTSRPLRFRIRKGKRPRNEKKRDDKLDEVQAKELRCLPPGSFSEYLHLFHSEHPLVRVSLKLFMRVSWCHNGDRDGDGPKTFGSR